jgi:hypothetical protein
MLKTIRDFIQNGSFNDEEEELEHLNRVWTALKEVTRDATDYEGVLSGGKKDPPLTKGSVPKDPTQQLADALQSLLLPHHESSGFKRGLKIVGIVGEGTDSKNSINYVNLCSQINDARQSGYKDAEIAMAVRKAVLPSSHLRTYFDTDEGITLEKMMGMIRSFYREKDSNELFTELSALCQTAHETATDFLIRSLQVRQKLLAASKAEGGMYDVKLVRNTFCRAVRTGLLNDQIRQHMKTLLNPKSPGEDQELLEEMNAASLECEETSSKLKRGAAKRVTINEGKVVSHSDLNPIMQGMTMLKQQLDDMKNSQAKNSQAAVPDRDNSEWRRNGYGPSQWEGRGRCPDCRKNGGSHCRHCFQCGSDQHIKRDCDQPQRGSASKNEGRL